MQTSEQIERETHTLRAAMARSRGRHVLTLSLLIASLVWPWASESMAGDSGFFGGFEAAISAADLVDEPANENEIGGGVGLHLGYRTSSGLAISGGITSAFFDFDTREMGVDLRNELNADLVDISVWYFLTLSEGLSLYLRGGGGRAFGTFSAAPEDGALASLPPGFSGDFDVSQAGVSVQEKGLGVIFAAGLDWKLRSTLRTFVEINGRWMGIVFEEVEALDTEFSCLSLSVGVGWAP